MKYYSGLAAAMILLLAVLACDSPPWSKVIVANESADQLLVKYKVSNFFLRDPCIYTKEQWERGDVECTTESRVLKMDHEGEKWVEMAVPSGGAVEIDRGNPYDLEENPEQTLSIDQLDLQGTLGSQSWRGPREIVAQFKREGGEFRPLWGGPPRYVYYYK
jgi:hypothetical protein